ncbi:NUDIX domain-containing protein [Colwellia sp. MSW7]|uniref:NUDIX domain-containing protein n=1 Tax=Colwellia maritima TaxID=2912588 RepID=A0ABS9WZV8_9GAMM|nr:NUDIX domain-containing protein [Colwellia maritima]MCI2283529.1 NUDIX domain-containing protein [Colwellia maritima]
MHHNTSSLASASLAEETIPEDCIRNLTVDNLIFTLHESKLKVLLVKYNRGLAINKWGLIGHWVRENENLEDAALRVVKKTTNVDNLYLDQLGAFGAVDRYPTSRIITIVYYSLVRHEETKLITGENAFECEWFDVYDLPNLMFDHGDILAAGLNYLKYIVRHEPIGFNLLPEKFTLLELQEIYEAILNKTLDKPNFRRKIQKMNLLINCQEKQKKVAHRAATLYRFDINVYEKLKEFGFTFEF